MAVVTERRNHTVSAGPEVSVFEAKQTQTVLLSDVPDPGTMMSATTGTATLADSDLSGDAAPLAQRYDILGAAGHFSLGSAWKARDRATQHLVILKLLDPGRAPEQGLMEVLSREILSLRKVSHQNVGRVFEMDSLGGITYLSTEYLDGESLRSVLRRLGAVPLRRALNLTLQICSGLKAAHGHGVAHRGLQPENILIDAKGTVKITDFGIARLVESTMGRTGWAGNIASPARGLSGKAAEFRTDIYALGLVLYEVFTGQRPVTPSCTASASGNAAPGALIPPHEIEPTVPVSIERAILRCLEADPAKRFGSIEELEGALMSSGARAVLASARDRAPTLTNRETVANHGGVIVPPTSKARARWRLASRLVWPIVAAIAVFAIGEGLHWATVSRAAKGVRPPSPVSAPVPPEFALEKRPMLRAIGKPASIIPSPGLESDAPFASPDRAVQAANPPSIGTRNSSDSPKSNSQGSASASLAGVNRQALADTYLWTARFPQESDARDSAKRIRDVGLPAIVVPRRNPNGEFFVLLAGPLETRRISDAETQLEDLGFLGVHPIKNLVIDHRQTP